MITAILILVAWSIGCAGLGAGLTFLFQGLRTMILIRRTCDDEDVTTPKQAELAQCGRMLEVLQSQYDDGEISRNDFHQLLNYYERRINQIEEKYEGTKIQN